MVHTKIAEFNHKTTSQVGNKQNLSVQLLQICHMSTFMSLWHTQNSSTYSIEKECTAFSRIIFYQQNNFWESEVMIKVFYWSKLKKKNTLDLNFPKQRWQSEKDKHDISVLLLWIPMCIKYLPSILHYA